MLAILHLLEMSETLLISIGSLLVSSLLPCRAHSPILFTCDIRDDLFPAIHQTSTSFLFDKKLAKFSNETLRH